MAVSIGSLMSDKVVVPVLKLSGLHMSLERNKGKANYDVIINNLKLEDEMEPEPA